MGGRGGTLRKTQQGRSAGKAQQEKLSREELGYWDEPDLGLIGDLTSTNVSDQTRLGRERAWKTAWTAGSKNNGLDSGLEKQQKGNCNMKPDIHPIYGPVAFRDQTMGTLFLMRSTLAARADQLPSITLADGMTYPLVTADVTCDSHPFYTGKSVVVDSAGQVQRFRRRYRLDG